MLDYEDVKRMKMEMMLNDPDFITGRGRLESLEYHLHGYVYFRGIQDGLKAAGLCEEEVRRVIGFVTKGAK